MPVFAVPVAGVCETVGLDFAHAANIAVAGVAVDVVAEGVAAGAWIVGLDAELIFGGIR